jgi:hypothetical protein
LDHWIIFAPDYRLSPAISKNNPLWTLWMRYPLSFFTHLHRWLNFRLIPYWMTRSPGDNTPPGTSRAFPESRLTSTQLELMVLLDLTSSSLQRWC